MDKPDINPSNYMQAKYSAALASYLGKANLSAANICDKIDSYILEQITSASMDDMCILLYPEQAADRLVNLTGYSISYQNIIYKHILYYMLARMSALNWVVKITYTLNDGYIDEIALSMPLDKMAIYQKPEAKPDAKPFSQTLTEPEAYTVKKNLKDLLGLLQINCANADMTFRPIVKPEVILSLLRSYLYNIEQVMAPELPLCQAMEQELNPIRDENRKARDMQNQKGDQLLKQAQGKIRTLYTDMYEAMESFVNGLGMSLLNLYFGQYGAVFIQIAQACPGLNRTGPLETVILKNTREPQIIDSDHNWNCVLDYFRQLDTGAFIQEAVLNRDRNIRSYTIGLRDFQAIHRLNGDVK